MAIFGLQGRYDVIRHCPATYLGVAVELHEYVAFSYAQPIALQAHSSSFASQVTRDGEYVIESHKTGKRASKGAF